MIDLASIVTTGGVILFYKALCQIKEDVLGRVIDGCLQQKNHLLLGTMKVEWIVLNEMGLIFIVAYQELFNIPFIDVLLSMLKTQYLRVYSSVLKENGIYKTIPQFDSGFEEVMQMWQVYCDKKNEKEIQQPRKQEKIEIQQQKIDSQPDEEQAAAKSPKLSKLELLKQSKKSGTKSPSTSSAKSPETRSPKSSVIMNQKITQQQMNALDFTQKNPQQTSQIQQKQQLEIDEDELLKQFVGSDDSLFSDEEEDQDKPKQSLFGKLTGKIQNLTGNKQLTQQDLDPVLEEFKTALMLKNVAEEIAQKICDSIKIKLLSTKTKAFTSVAKTVRESMKETLVKILTPNRNIDVIAEALRAKEKQKPYVIVFIGVNGVGKSTTLAKVAYLFKSQGFSVLIAACDNFRAGAVEQLKTHGQNLNIPIYDRGYKDEPPEIAYQAIREATIKKIDVVLVDTAGRMQHNEPLMRALSRIVTMNNPDLVLFVGEALVGNDGVDQLINFNKALIVNSPKDNVREIDGIILSKFDTVDEKVGASLSLTSATGKPILFVGVGQKYTHLRKLNVNTVVRALLS